MTISKVEKRPFSMPTYRVCLVLAITLHMAVAVTIGKRSRSCLISPCWKNNGSSSQTGRRIARFMKSKDLLHNTQRTMVKQPPPRPLCDLILTVRSRQPGTI